MGVSIAVDRLCRGWRTWTSSCAFHKESCNQRGLGLSLFSRTYRVFWRPFRRELQHWWFSFLPILLGKRICFANETEM
jgi:hypothetical protein